ncbi:hypothetical protein BDR04DRAFT_196834 [Suillus decipiens]|nr:hypothetical protein BDR04DRAFT_196834 [Suillus decipiens]
MTSAVVLNRDVATSNILAMLRRTCHALRQLAGEVARRRFARLIQLFASTVLPAFIRVQQCHGGVITGPSAHAIVSGDESVIARLNIVVLHTSFQALETFIENTLGYPPMSTVAHPAIAYVLGRFGQYACNQRIITLSVSHVRQSVLQVILNAPTTADMVLVLLLTVAPPKTCACQARGSSSRLNDWILCQVMSLLMLL